MIIVFLDIDGVMNSTDWYLEKHRAGIKPSIADEDNIDPHCIQVLNMFHEQYPDLCIVLTSTRRHNMSLSAWRQVLSDLGCTLPILDKTPHIDILNRGAEVKKWLSDHDMKDFKRYVIIDDENDFDFDQAFNIVLTLEGQGLRSYYSVENLATTLTLVDGFKQEPSYTAQRLFNKFLLNT